MGARQPWVGQPAFPGRTIPVLLQYLRTRRQLRS